jgi:hypothetical protein
MEADREFRQLLDRVRKNDEDAVKDTSRPISMTMKAFTWTSEACRRPRRD